MLHGSPTTAGNEWKRGIPPRKSNRGREPECFPEYGQQCCGKAQKRSRRDPVWPLRISFAQNMIREKHWPLDAFAGFIRTDQLFLPEEITGTKTLSHAVWNGTINFTPTELPQALKRKKVKDEKEKPAGKTMGQVWKNVPKRHLKGSNSGTGRGTRLQGSEMAGVPWG